MHKIQSILSKQLISMIIFFVLLSMVQAFEYNIDGTIKFSNVTDNLFSTENVVDNQDQIIAGYLKNDFIFDNLQLHLNILIGDNIYTSSIDAIGGLEFLIGVSYYDETSLLSVGEFGSVASKAFYNRLFALREYSIGTSHLTTERVMNGEHYTFNSSHITNNNNFNVLYIKSFLNETLYVGFSFIPTLKNSRSEIFKKENKFAIDNIVIYYNEYNGIGYGADIATRHYFANNKEQKQESINRDIAFGGVLDFFGFSLKSHYLRGNNNYSLGGSFANSYSAFESSLYYSFYKFLVGVYYIDSHIQTDVINYDTNLVELDIQYHMSKNFTVYTGYLYEVTNKFDNQGVLIGISLNI